MSGGRFTFADAWIIGRELAKAMTLFALLMAFILVLCAVDPFVSKGAR